MSGLSWIQTVLHSDGISEFLLKKGDFEKRSADKKKNHKNLPNMQSRSRLFQDHKELFQFFDENSNGVLDFQEIGKLNAAMYNLFPRFGYKGTEQPGTEIFSLSDTEY